MEFLDRLGWPVERIKGRPVTNLIRLLIHTRKIVRKWPPPSLDDKLKRAAVLMSAAPGTPEGAELDRLSDEIVQIERTAEPSHER